MESIQDQTSGPDIEDFPDSYLLTEDASDELQAYRRCQHAGEPSAQRRKHLLKAVLLIGQAIEAEKRSDAALGLKEGE